MRIQERIHIIPIGDDDVDRIVCAPVEGKADRVYLLTMKNLDLFKELVQQSQERLEELRIKTIIKKVDMLNFNELILSIAMILRTEMTRHNHVFLSISTGGNLAAAASMFISTLFQVQAYFMVKDFHTQTLKSEILTLPTFHISPPSKNLILFLDQISYRYQATNKNRKTENSKGISKKECLQIMTHIHQDEPLSGTSGDYNKLKFRYLDKLLEKRFIRIDNHPRGKILLTEEGQLALELYSIYYNLGESGC